MEYPVSDGEGEEEEEFLVGPPPPEVVEELDLGGWAGSQGAQTAGLC